MRSASRVSIDPAAISGSNSKSSPAFSSAARRPGDWLRSIAESYWHIHRQPRSAWAQEIDLRPFKESF